MLLKKVIYISKADILKTGESTINLHLFDIDSIIFYRRWFVLTKSHILSYKDERLYKNPTEAIPMSTCCTVKSVEEEINKPNAFVFSNILLYWLIFFNYRSWK